MPQENRYWVPTRSYDVEVKIKELNYEVYRIEIGTNISKPYQVIILDLFIDAEDLILQEVYGGEPVKLSIKLLQENEQLLDQIDYELIYVSAPSGFQMPVKPSNIDVKHKDRSAIRIVTVPKNSFKTMNTMVNNVYIEKTQREIIEDVISDTNTTLEYDTEKENDSRIDQVLIPPMTVYKAIKYLDNMFGLHTGVTSCFCDYENKLQLMNLSSRIKNPQTFTIFHLVSDLDNTEEIEKTTDGKHFVCYANVTTDYVGNSVFSVLGKTMKHIVKPKDAFYYLIERDLETVCADEGLISKDSNVYLDDAVTERTKYYINHTGYETSETFIESAKKISSLSLMNLYLERNLNLLNLIKVGETVKFDSKNVNYTNLCGMYILRSSGIVLYRESDWQATARIDLIRTNKIN